MTTDFTDDTDLFAERRTGESVSSVKSVVSSPMKTSAETPIFEPVTADDFEALAARGEKEWDIYYVRPPQS